MQWRASNMWETHDDNWTVKDGKSKNSDIDIDIDVNVNRDGEPCFDKIFRAGASAVGAQSGLNLLDVARGLEDVQSELRGCGGNAFDAIHNGARDGFSDGIRDGIHDGIHDGIRDAFRDGFGAGRAIGKGLGDAADQGGLDFNPSKAREGELPYIDCGWGRLLEKNKTDMLHRAGKIGARLKDAEA